MLTDLIQLPDTTHSYSGGGTGSQGIDGNFNTAQEAAGGGSHAIVSTHMFANPHDITQLKFRLYMHGYAYGDDEAHVDGNYHIQYTLNGVDWIDVTDGSKMPGTM